MVRKMVEKGLKVAEEKLEPLRGTADHVGALLDECDTAAELLTRLGS